jgi:hypothetical protein
MRVLKDEFCPQCGGTLRVGEYEISCLSCNLTKPIPPIPKIRKALEEKTVEAPNTELTTAGNFIERATRDGNFFGDINKVTRLVVNISEGYQLKDADAEWLIKAGFLRMKEEV